MKQEQDTKILEIKIKEISDSRQLLNSGITKMETQLNNFRDQKFAL